jgi:DNA-binding NtrC family response regulator
MVNILVVTAEARARQSISGCFAGACALDIAADKDAALSLLKQKKYEFAFLDLALLSTPVSGGEESCEESLDSFWELSDGAEIVVLSPPDMVHEAVDAVRDGANSYLIHPVDPAEVRYVVESTRESRHLGDDIEHMGDDFWLPQARDYVTTHSPLMRRSLDLIRSVARTNMTVLLSGETGTGKGLLAKLLHQHSAQSAGPFVSVHCGAIPENLIESELFGHEKGAFTGASGRKLGKFEVAKGGTIFLDEVGTMAPDAQVKLLKVLQDKVFQRVGGAADIEADVRVVAATNGDLLKMSETGAFRSDLYYRLSVFPVEVPPLRDRREDIEHLAGVILAGFNATYDKGIGGFHRLVLKGFMQYPWPGNIRELANVMERAYILETSSVLTAQSFPPDMAAPESSGATVEVDVSSTLAEVRRRGIEEIERMYLEEMLARHRGRIDKTAECAGITPRQLHKLMTRYAIRKESYK